MTFAFCKKPNATELIYRCFLDFCLLFFSHEVAFNLAIDLAGGTLIAWKRTFRLINSWSTRHTVTVLLQQISSGELLTVINAYGPSEDPLKPAFIQELGFAASKASPHCILAGDFNLVRWLTDQSGNQRSFRLMELFNELVTNTGLIDVPLRNRSFTWSSSRP